MKNTNLMTEDLITKMYKDVLDSHQKYLEKTLARNEISYMLREDFEKRLCEIKEEKRKLGYHN